MYVKADFPQMIFFAAKLYHYFSKYIKVHGANMGPNWALSVPDGPHDGTMNLAIRDINRKCDLTSTLALIALHVLHALLCNSGMRCIENLLKCQ